MGTEEKSVGQVLQERLEKKNETAWQKVNEEEKVVIFNFCEGYKGFLNAAKTEREAIEYAKSKAEQNGFQPLKRYIEEGRRLQPGDKVYVINRDKNIILAVIGNSPVESGMKITGAHIDSPRIDLKSNPLYEEAELGLLKTHYYGGIKKYQWTTIPLTIHGVVYKADGEKVMINIGENDNDPQFCITDLLPHLAKEQMDKKANEVVAGEDLNILFGSIPYNDDKLKDKIKINLLELLNQKYGIVEEDFRRAEIEVVPAFKARDIGLDRSMVGSYGQDDRICGYTSLEAILQINNPNRTTICVLIDKEEIGSMGNTGFMSRFFENTIAEICQLTSDNYNDIILRRTLSNSELLSADVTAAVDPTYDSVNEKRNSSFMGRGVTIEKYTGSRGKYDASDANAEFLSKILSILSQNNVAWQTGEIGKVDMGGGGTIAQYAANLGLDVLDVGPPILCMHSPFEVASKIDVYMTYKAYLAFFNY